MGSLSKTKKPGASLAKAAQKKLSKPTKTSVRYRGSNPRISSNSSGRYSPPAPPSIPAGGGPVPDINAFLGGDAGYQQQLRQLAKAWSDFRADENRRRGVLTTEHGLSKKALADQRLTDLDAIEEDYGSRGLLRSGLYGSAVGDYEKEYGLRVSDLDRQQQQALQMLSQEHSKLGQQNTLQQQAAREAAIRRRAEQYGL